MELSHEIQTILQKYRPQHAARPMSDNELIDITQVDFDDETWLMPSLPVTNLSSFLNVETDMQTSGDSSSEASHKQFPASYDSRTFTRPKRKSLRSSVNIISSPHHSSTATTTSIVKPISGKFVENQIPLSEQFEKYMSISSTSTTLEDGMSERSCVCVPVNFDLSQPITTSCSESFFDNIASGSIDHDSFQNMSPPSLVNSMCSSTFTNLMENSFIKNDPVLREIRDADYSTVINLEMEEMEPQLYQSITESCSSINTEIAETFVRKTLNSLNCTFGIDSNEEHEENIDPNATFVNVNANSQKIGGLNGTFFQSDGADMKETIIGNTTFLGQKVPSQFRTFSRSTNPPKHKFTETITKTEDKIALNETYRFESGDVILDNQDWNSTFTKQGKPLNSPKLDKRASLNSTFSKISQVDCKIDNFMCDNLEKGLSDDIDEYLTKKWTQLSDADDKQFEADSAKSTESIDRLSSISNVSNSSHESFKLMAEVDAIVERQERSLQVMSTPKPAKSLTSSKSPFQQVKLSPIPNLNLRDVKNSFKAQLTDSEASSDDYNTVRSRFSGMNSASHGIPSGRLSAAQSWNNARWAGIADAASTASKRKSIHTVSDLELQLQRPSSGFSLRKENKMSGSYTNLGNLRKLNSNFGGSYSNLRAVKPSRPKSEVLYAKADFKVPQIPAKSRPVANPNVSNLNGTFVKPTATPTQSAQAAQNIQVTKLPRPSTGIPRPASRIPGPRSSRLPLSRNKATSRTNLSDNY